MSAIGLLPWPVHQGFVYAAGVFSVLVPFLFDLIEGTTLPLFVGTGVILLGIGVLSRGPGGVAQVLPYSVHAGAVYLLGFFLVISPFVFGFSDEETPLLVAIALGLATLVVTLVTRFPAPAEHEPAAPTVDASGDTAPAEGTDGDGDDTGPDQDPRASDRERPNRADEEAPDA